MRGVRISIAASLTLAAAVLAAPARSDACSCGKPSGEFVRGAGGVLPADAVGIAWRGRISADEVLQFKRFVNSKWVDEPFTLQGAAVGELIVPGGGLRPGDIFKVQVVPDRARDPDGRTTALTVAAETIDLAAATLVLSPRRKEVIHLAPGRGGSCSHEVVADVVRASITLPPALEPYRAYLIYEILIDGEPYEPPPSSICTRSSGLFPLRHGPELLFTACDGTIGLWPGRHQVALEVWTPDGRSVRTASLGFEVDCQTSPPPTDAAPTTAAPTAAAPTTEPSPPVVAAGPAGPPPVARGCTLGAPAPWWLLLLLVRRGARRSSACDVRLCRGPTTGRLVLHAWCGTSYNANQCPRLLRRGVGWLRRKVVA